MVLTYVLAWHTGSFPRFPPSCVAPASVCLRTAVSLSNSTSIPQRRGLLCVRGRSLRERASVPAHWPGDVAGAAGAKAVRDVRFCAEPKGGNRQGHKGCSWYVRGDATYGVGGAHSQLSRGGTRFRLLSASSDSRVCPGSVQGSSRVAGDS
jgi:hypothetical protein